ncbi:polysaccharide deacetylase [Pseudoalteromonas aurantia]|nr:polysaccharide deacetylase [Pseudoalteromonas aurantia]
MLSLYFVKSNNTFYILIFGWFILQKQYVRTPYLPGWGQVPLQQFSRQSSLKNKFILCGNGNSKSLALTFDDGPSKYTNDILSVLRKHNVKASFFMTGKSLYRDQVIAKNVYRQGHLIGNHTFSHPWASQKNNFNLMYLQIRKTQNIMEDVLGFKPQYFRPAFGDITDLQLKIINRYGCEVIGWSIDTQDWFYDDNPKKIANNALSNLHNEAIILLHDGGGSRISTTKAIDILIRKAKAQGYRFVTIDALVSNKKKKLIRMKNARF